MADSGVVVCAEKFSKIQARYTPVAPYPAIKSCGLCEHFYMGECSLVAGSISSTAGCALYMPKVLPL